MASAAPRARSCASSRALGGVVQIRKSSAAENRMKIFVAYCFGLLGFLLQGSAVIGLPVYVFFFGGSSWWMLAFFPLGFAGMIPLSIMSSMLKKEKGE